MAVDMISKALLTLLAIYLCIGLVSADNTGTWEGWVLMLLILVAVLIFPTLIMIFILLLFVFFLLLQFLLISLFQLLIFYIANKNKGSKLPYNRLILGLGILNIPPTIGIILIFIISSIPSLLTIPSIVQIIIISLIPLIYLIYSNYLGTIFFKWILSGHSGMSDSDILTLMRLISIPIFLSSGLLLALIFGLSLVDINITIDS